MPPVTVLGKIAPRKGVSTVQVALVPLLAQKPFIVPIPGMDKPAYVEDNMKAIDVELAAADLAEIEERLKRIEIRGARPSQALLDDVHDQID